MFLYLKLFGEADRLSQQIKPVELQVLLSALILPYKIKKKLSKEIQLHE